VRQTAFRGDFRSKLLPKPSILKPNRSDIVKYDQKMTSNRSSVTTHFSAAQTPSLHFSQVCVARRWRCPTSRWWKRRFPTHSQFACQEGSSAFSVSPSQIPKVQTYLENQEEHPRKRSFAEELRDLLRHTSWNSRRRTCLD
jgi:hypothetical protein